MTRPEIVYLTPPKPVSMGDAWFEIASLDHFWMVRRFDVLCRLAGGIIGSSRQMAEIGCGNGALQAQVEARFDREVDGFDLNEHALKLSVAARSPRHCYDIRECRDDLRDRYDLIFLFDIIEHIEDEAGFMEAALHHLAPGGHLIINVPALQWLFSPYDRAAGHVRRYTVAMLRSLAARHGLAKLEISYWGMPLVPLLVLRKVMLAVRKRTDDEILHSGFKPPSKLWNRALGLLARCEPLPQRVVGSSVMAVLRKP